MRIQPQLHGASIVLLGHFNPMIFRPDWFRDKNILVGSDSEGVQINVIHPDVVHFGLPWGQVHVQRDQFFVAAVQEPLIRLQDFFVSCFQRLPETPVGALGLNRDVHFDSGSVQALNEIGDVLAPKEFWGDFVSHDGQRAGGLRSLIMAQSRPENNEMVRLDGKKGWIRVQVEPSVKIRPTGVFVQVNDHYDMTNKGDLSDARAAIEVVANCWEHSVNMADQLIDRIMGIVHA